MNVFLSTHRCRKCTPFQPNDKTLRKVIMNTDIKIAGQERKNICQDLFKEMRDE